MVGWSRGPWAEPLGLSEWPQRSQDTPPSPPTDHPPAGHPWGTVFLLRGMKHALLPSQSAGPDNRSPSAHHSRGAVVLNIPHQALRRRSAC